MTLLSIAASCLVAICCGLGAGRLLRGSREAIALASALSVAAGLVLMQTSKWSDLLRIFQPKVAIDWLPLATFLGAAILMIKDAKLRIAFGTILAILTPIRLLWGSVHLQLGELKLGTIVIISVWSVALAVPFFLQEKPQEKRLNWKTLSWIVAAAGTAMIVAASGSMTYGMAVGVCAFAILGVLLATSQIHNMSAFTIVALIGLSAAYAELPVWNAGLLLVAWSGAMIAENSTPGHTRIMVRIATFGLVLFVGVLAMTRLRDDLATKQQWGDAYSSFGEESANPSQESSNRSPSTPTDLTLPSSSSKSSEPQDSTIRPPDPFDGFDL